MTVLVTGASRGIGRAVAIRLAETHDVAVNHRDSVEDAEEVAEAIRERGAEALVIQADVRDPDAVKAMVETTAERFGGLDAVVNNAGIISPTRLADIDPNRWHEVVETNLSGAFYVSRAAAPSLVAEAGTEGGDIVNISSIGGTDGTVDAAYAASKAGLHGLTRALARELGPEGVQVNAVAPGPVEGEMNDEIVEFLEHEEFHGHENIGTLLPEYACSPEDVAHTVEYLLENEFVQGEIVSVNGGMGLR
ncbi:MAG: SDR family oxidoreductase [Euryarchaeota archaeon]|jgi:3-oxoacyl-[acyl-carrier protein] reductase|nr:SDR family oxidoreductase [Euryarchaeota archaeon]